MYSLERFRGVAPAARIIRATRIAQTSASILYKRNDHRARAYFTIAAKFSASYVVVVR